MRHAEARAEIETRLAAAWTATPVAYENVAFQPPAAGAARVRKFRTDHCTNGGIP